MAQTNNINVNNLADTNKEIFEFKKKIQLSEGQRKAHYEEWDGEKKRNKDKLQQLKMEIKNLHVQLASTGQNTDSILRATMKYPKEMGALRNKKSGDEIIVVLDCKATDLKKKLDQLHHESKKCQNRMKMLADEYHTLLHRKTTFQVKKHAETAESLENTALSSLFQEICMLENQIHRVEMNLMEAEHVQKKYRIIQGSLLEDRVAFESSLVKVEENIKKQEAEIRHLKEIYGEALKLRDATRGTLVRQEFNTVNIARVREKELQDLRFQVEERRLELERLERRIFPIGRTLVHQESTSSLEGAQSADDSTANITTYFEKAFEKLKAATGETDPEDVLKIFQSQKETLSRLSYLRNITEKEKLELQRQKDSMVAKLEAFKFAEVKDNEQ
ncbi:Coiled-coil domain-containing protein 151 [Zootermopsis nevadensis]|uniref:Coiled-coil domain-containing protein 151 n=2 Tax=Zootermopsis nevadensis TaxID=136037 RepID=A0A067QJG7_ZOONE|nr:Coiled-coil domain-containing protein 151 [Zootermopsis nevadensis]